MMNRISKRYVKRLIGRTLCGLGLISLTVPCLAKIGLETKFGDIVVEHVEPGATYNFREARQVPFIVKNRGTAPTEVIVEVTVPKKEKMKDGYEPIPDPAWIKIVPDGMTLQVQENGFFDIILSVPDDPRWNGRHYQADIWAHTGGAGFFGVGVTGRVRFSTGPGPKALRAERLKKLMYTLDFEMTPDSLTLNNLPLGKTVDVKKTFGKSIKMANFAEKRVPFRFKVIPWDSRFVLPPGYEPGPDPRWITLSPNDLPVEGSSIGQVKLSIAVPKDKTHQGKKYAFLVQVGIKDGMDLEVYTRVYITIP